MSLVDYFFGTQYINIGLIAVQPKIEKSGSFFSAMRAVQLKFGVKFDTDVEGRNTQLFEDRF